MKLKINKYVEISISEPNELLELMTSEEKLELIESLSCHDEVITHVVNQINELHGCTENGHSGWSSGVLGSSPLGKARLDIANKSSAMAEKIINSLQENLKRRETQINELYDEISKLEGH